MWSPCLWVTITCPTESQPRPIFSSAAAMSPSLPAVPVSTTAASPRRARMYAETNPRLTRSQVKLSPGTPDAAADESAEAAGGDADPGPDAVGEPSLARLVAAPDAPEPAGAHPVTPTTASATAPRPR